MKSGAVYKVGYKAVSDLNGEETFIAKATFKNGKTKDNIVFKTDKGAKVETEWIDAATAKITIKKTFDFAKESIIATVSPTTPKTEEPKAKDDIAGKVNIWHLSQKPINVTLVSVNGATIPAKAAEDLNTIYNKAGVLFSVKEENIRIDNLPNKIICGSSDLLNTYTLDQISITTAIRKALGSSYDKETYYMLYTGSTADNGVDGFMPLGRQYGFIFDNKNHTLAHELGHGALRLEHPFTEFKTTKGSTTLLMDYADGTKLDHNNWQSIHGGGWKPYLFQNDADGALAGGYGLAPDFSFVNNGDETTVANLNSVTEGFVGGFISNKATYKWENDKYIGTDGEIFETLKKEPELNTKIYLFYNNDQDCGKSNFLRTIYTEELQKIIKAEDNKKLVTFIKKYADNQSLQQKLKDENRVTYWGFVACNSNTSSSQTALIDCPTLPADFNKLDVDYLVNHFFASKSATCLATIPLEKRKELLKTMLKNWTVTSCLESESYPNSRIGNCYEPLVYKLILSTKTADEKALLDWFVSENVIFPLLDKTQFKTFDDIANKLNGWILSYYPMKGEVAVKNALEGSLKKIEFEENKVTASIQKEGIQLIREASGQCKECIPVSKIEITVAYNDYVLVHFKDNVGVFKAGTTARMPAIQALYLFNKDRRDLVITTSKVTFEVALLGLGVGEIGIAYDAYMTGRTAYAAYIGVKAMTDVGMGLGDIYIQNSLAEEWSNSPEGQKKLERWNTINKWYAVSTISLSGIDLAFQKYGRKITSTNAEEFLDEIEKGVNTAGNLVPSSLITKLNQNGATKLKTWTSGKSLNFVDDAGNVLTGANAEAKIFEKLESSIGSKTVLETTTDANGRLLVQTERGTNSNRVLSIETNKNGQVVVKEYAPSYKSTANTDIDVDLSKGMLAPDYTTKGGKYLYPKTSLQSGQKNVVEITMTGNMRNDFKAANEAAGFSSFGYDAPKRGDIQFTWHHLDDFNPVTGKVTAQLVDQSAHTKVVGMGHSGGVAQYKMFNGSGY
ncbi:HNH endonuclease [Flavobacterium frigoris]